MHELLGVISEEIDTLYPADKNGIRISYKGMDTVFEVKDYAEILRVKDAQILGTYTEDFYKDSAAITCKNYGNGKAYYQAARCSADDLGDLIRILLEEAGIGIKDIPAGIEYHKRIGKNATYEFYLNLSTNSIELSNIDGINLMTGERISGIMSLGIREYLVLKD